MTRKTKNTISTILRYVVLCAVGVLMFYPMLWMVGASLTPSFAAYVKGWTATGYSFGKFMMNTYIIVFPKVVGIVISTIITAYGFSRFQFVGKTFLFAVLMSTLFLPQVVLNIPQFLMFTDLGWVDTYKPLVVPSFFANEPYVVFMLVQFMR